MDSSPGSKFSILSDPALQFPSLNPPKRKRDLAEFVAHNFFDKNKRLEELQDGPKFLIIKRNEQNKEVTLKTVSCFLIDKAIQTFAGTVKSTKRLRDGTLLVETMNKLQADRMCKMTKFIDEIKVKVELHPTLNTTKGTIFCNDLKYCSNEEIMENLKSQHVSEVRRIMRKAPPGFMKEQHTDENHATQKVPHSNNNEKKR